MTKHIVWLSQEGAGIGEACFNPQLTVPIVLTLSPQKKKSKQEKDKCKHPICHYYTPIFKKNIYTKSKLQLFFFFFFFFFL